MSSPPVPPSLIDAFLTNISHEIRTPMTAIFGYADLLLLEIRDSSYRIPLQAIRENGQHLLELLSNIIDLSQAESGLLESDASRFAPCAFIEDVVSTFRIAAYHKKITLVVEFAGPLPETIDSDPARLRQILTQIVGNGIKFTDQGSVRIRVRMQSAESTSPSMFCIDVIDTGIGIEPEVVASLFRPFIQADGSLTRRHGGAGIGLALSSHLARILGGSISIDSTPKKGTRVTISIDPGNLAGIPLRTFNSPGTAPQPAEAPTQGETLPIRVLIAEDIPAMLKLIGFHFRRAGSRTSLVQNGDEVLKAVARADAEGDPFDLLVLDMQMPVMDGYSAARALRNAGSRIPIIALTAHALVGDQEKCLAAGCNAYCVKPIDHPKLIGVAFRLTRRTNSPPQPAHITWRDRDASMLPMRAKSDGASYEKCGEAGQ